MGYFSNGTEGEIYQEAFCFKCSHWKDEDDGRGPGCPVWDAHLLYNHAEHEQGGHILDLLIPVDDEGVNLRCSMFVKAPS